MSALARMAQPVREAGWAISDSIARRRRPAKPRAAVAPAANGSPNTNGAPLPNGAGAANDAAPRPDPELRLERDRLIEKYTIMQSDLGGAFYEMAIRDHVRLDVLTRKAAELQRVDAELAQVERAIELERTGAVGHCANCDAPYGPGVAFCSQCGHPLVHRESAA